MVHYAEPFWYSNNPNFKGKFEFKDRYEFNDSLAFVQYVHGRSRITITLESTSDHRKYDTTLNGFIDMVNSGIVHQANGRVVITGKFGFAKKGTTIATVLVK